MFILRLLNSFDPSYIRTGIRQKTPSLPLLRSIDVLIGDVPADLELVCAQVTEAIHDGKPSSELRHFRTQLNSVDLREAMPGVTASVLSARVRLAIHLLLAQDTTSDAERRELASTIKQSIGPCWDAFKTIFETAAHAPVDDTDFLPRYTSRFIYFLRCYLPVTERTERNRNHAETLATLLTACLLQYAASLPPSEVGARYYTPKMIREIVLTLHEEYPRSTVLKDDALLTLGVSYDYLSCLTIDEARFPLANLLLNGKRTVYDTQLERLATPFPEPIKRYFRHRMLHETLQTLSRIAMRNTFGAETAKPYAEPDALHLKIFLSDELQPSYLVVLVHNREIALERVRVSVEEVTKTMQAALKASQQGESEAIRHWAALAQLLQLQRVLEKAQAFCGGILPQRVLVYPDGPLWNAPWGFLLSYALTPGGQSAKACPTIAVKLGGRPAVTNATARRAYFAAGWKYRQSSRNAPSAYRGRPAAGSFANLPGARREVQALQRFWKRAGRPADLATDATADSVLAAVNQLAEPSIFHLACHGESAESDIPILWLPANGATPATTALHYERLLRVSWKNVEFVFVNACFGASGVGFVGGPSLGMSEALSIAGVRLLLAPLWPVDDNDAAMLAEQFYDGLVKGNDYLDTYHAVFQQFHTMTDTGALPTPLAYNFFIL